MDDPIAFAEAQLDEDEAAANAANVKQDDPEWWCSPVQAARIMGRHGATTVRSKRDRRPIARVESCSGDSPADITDGDAVALHIARHDPARALREVAAGRRILARHRDCAGRGTGPCAEFPVGDGLLCAELGDLLYRWADHPDYRLEWMPAAAQVQ